MNQHLRGLAVIEKVGEWHQGINILFKSEVIRSYIYRSSVEDAFCPHIPVFAEPRNFKKKVSLVGR